MNKLEKIEAEIGKLSREELRQIRDWIDDILEDQMEFKEEFESTIAQAERDMKAGRSTRVRSF